MSDFSRAELVTEAQWRKCKRDPAYFFRNFWHIQHPERGAILFELFDPQFRALDTFRSERLVITLKARQIGWTTLVAAYAFWLTFFYPDRPIIFLSKGEREAKNILKMVKYGYQRLPQWLRERGPRILADNQTEFPMANGSTIESLPSKSDPARGRTVYLVVVDEWASLENPEDAWSSIEPVADVGGRIIGLSTAKGWGNFFHTMWVEAESGISDFCPIFEPWSARSDRDDAWYSAKQRSLPEHILHQEYPRNPEEAFLKSGNMFFNADVLAAMEPVEPRKGFLTVRDGYSFVQGAGPLRVWEEPQHNEVYVLGADTAEGLEHGDYSSAHVIKHSTGEVVAHWHGHLEPGPFGEELDHLGRWYNDALCGPEANNHGHTVIDRLKENRYPNLYYHRTTDTRTKKITEKMGWQTTKTTRGPMLDDLGEQLALGGLIVYCKETIFELRTFIRDENAKLHGSPHDDRVMSLGIANQMRDYVSLNGPGSRKRPGMWTLAWWVREADKDDKKKKKQPIGTFNRA